MVSKDKLTDFAVKFAASAGFSGYCPVWPGAVGSLVGIALAWFFSSQILYLFIGATVIGLWVCEPSEKIWGRKDPQKFVLDEVGGMLLSVLWLPKDPTVFVAGYFLFRFFDVLKPWPISRLQKSPSPYGIMWDDLAAGLISNLILQVATRFF